MTVTLEDLALDPWRIEAGLPTAWERMIAETAAEVLAAQWFEPTPGGTVTAYEGLAAWLPADWKPGEIGRCFSVERSRGRG